MRSRFKALAFVTSLAVLIVAVSTATAVETSTGPSRSPNILLIIADDVGLDVTTDMYPGLIDELVEKYGPNGRNHPDYKAIKGRPASTPTLDGLARSGMIFRNVWANPYCSPTRATILTGLFSAKNKVLTYADPLSQNHTSFVRKLKDEAGYSTGLFGKWHLAGLPGNPVSYSGIKPKQAGFDLFKGNLHAAIKTYWDYDYQMQDDATPADQWRTEKPPQRSLPGIAPTTFAPVVKVADAIDWIAAQEEAAPDKPWFAWLAFNLSHATAQQQPSAMAAPNADTLDARSRQEMLACGGTFGSSNTGTCTGEQLMRAMTNSLDTLTGRLLEVVDKLDPNTYVILVGDNGTPMYGRPNLDFIDNMYITKKGRGKGTTYESGARVAMAIRGPNIEAGASNNDYVHTADLFSTILNLAGLEPPEQVSNSEGTGTVPLDAVSLAPLLFSSAATVRDPNEGYLLSETIDLLKNSTRQAGARNASHKIICTNGTGAGACEFYNLAADPLEEYPLSIPEECAAYANKTWTPADPSWHFCRLKEVVETQSFFRQQAKQ